VDDPSLDTAISRALLIRTDGAALGPTLRLNTTNRIVAFGKHDTLSPGYPAAVHAARDRGFDTVERLAGGRAAVFHERTLAFSWTIPDENPMAGIQERFQTVADLMVRAFSRLGISAFVGEVPGEYCPGAYSVHVAPGRKVMGIGQRLVKKAVHLGGVVVVRDGNTVRDALVPVYAALGLEWRPETAGSLADAANGVTVADTAAAILAEVGMVGPLIFDDLDDATMSLAEQLAQEHRPPPSDGRQDEYDLHLRIVR
jgi:lipoate-protein ligase A